MTLSVAHPADALFRTTSHDPTQAGDVFQVVLGQRFERRTFADPFEVYRALRVVNPSPYMIYMQARGSMLVASSPEILCRVTSEGTVVNRPLAGTRKRGATPEEDLALEKNLLVRSRLRPLLFSRPLPPLPLLLARLLPALLRAADAPPAALRRCAGSPACCANKKR